MIAFLTVRPSIFAFICHKEVLKIIGLLSKNKLKENFKKYSKLFVIRGIYFAP